MKTKYAIPKPGKPVIIDGQWSLRHTAREDGLTTYKLYRKGAGPSHWNSRGTIYETKGGCFIVTSNGPLDAFVCWSMAVDKLIERAQAGGR